MEGAPRFAMVAGEASGDLLAGLVMDAMRARYHRQYYQRDWTDPIHYHMTLNTGMLGLAGATALIVERATAMGWLEAVRR